jgi:hypothetical protein
MVPFKAASPSADSEVIRLAAGDPTLTLRPRSRQSLWSLEFGAVGLSPPLGPQPSHGEIIATGGSALVDATG